MNKKIKIKIFFLVVFLFFSPIAVSAVGEIDAVSKYAWSSNGGWINFGTTHGATKVRDSVVHGYAWSENYGWINMAPVNGGVKNDGVGNLSGYAWGEKIGWIDFTGISIDENGLFSGQIQNDILGTITFDCAKCAVKTSWRQASVNTGTSIISSSGNSLPTISIPVIENGDEPIESAVEQKVVLMENITEDRNVQSKVVVKTEVNEEKYLGQEIIGKVKQYLVDLKDKVTDLFLVENPTDWLANLPSPEQSLTVESPDSLKGMWSFLPMEPINNFVFAPLPMEVTELLTKIPEVRTTFEKLMVSRLTDLQSLRSVNLVLPGINNLANGTVGEQLSSDDLIKFGGLMVADLPSEIKNLLPMDLVFVQSGGLGLDINTNLVITDKGEIQQQIHTGSGKLINLAIRPAKAVISIEGRVIFKQKEILSRGDFQAPMSSIFGNLLFATPALAITDDVLPVVEEKLVTQKFFYFDHDQDGLYTAEIQAPAAQGEYEIMTVLNYYDNQQKVLHLTTLVDPDGYVYELVDGREIRIKDAIVTLFWYNDKDKQFVVWPAEKFRQNNPQITKISGTYGFLAPPGKYYLSVKSSGYQEYIGQNFTLSGGSGVHENVRLNKKFWAKVIDWKILLIIFLGSICGYSFYKNKLKKKRFY